MGRRRSIVYGALDGRECLSSVPTPNMPAMALVAEGVDLSNLTHTQQFWLKKPYSVFMCPVCATSNIHEILILEHVPCLYSPLTMGYDPTLL